MTKLQSSSPPDLTFAPRRPSFEIEQALATDWHSGSAFKTAFFNAFSMLFPIGEKFFIDSVLYFKDQIDDPRLLAEIKAFQGQESAHRLEHQRYNEILCRLRGYDLKKIEEPLVRRQAWVYKNLSPTRRLAGTAAYEHLTAILADDMLRNDDVMKGADPAVAELWRWHGIEETEHKSVAFDVYVATGGTVAERRGALLMNTWYFFKDVFGILRYMLKVEGKHTGIREWMSGLNFLFGYPGILRRLTFKYFRFFGKQFHPWNNDNRDLIDQWTNQQAQSDHRH
jgi:predicted metal-dependent hydrolase